MEPTSIPLFPGGYVLRRWLPLLVHLSFMVLPLPPCLPRALTIIITRNYCSPLWGISPISEFIRSIKIARILRGSHPSNAYSFTLTHALFRNISYSPLALCRLFLCSIFVGLTCCLLIGSYSLSLLSIILRFIVTLSLFLCQRSIYFSLFVTQKSSYFHTHRLFFCPISHHKNNSCALESWNLDLHVI